MVTTNLEGNTITIHDDFRNFTTQGEPDPRVPVEDGGRVGVDGVTQVWVQTKYPNRGAPIPIATWDEAQLIIAEAELEAGNLDAAVSAINAARQGTGLPEFDSDDAQEIRQQLIHDRSAELFLESHLLFDLVRFEIPLDPPPGTSYPPKGGGQYGDQTCFPLPDAERNNNPNI